MQQLFALWSVTGNFVLKVRFIGQRLWYLIVTKGAVGPAAVGRPHSAGKQKKISIRQFGAVRKQEGRDDHVGEKIWVIYLSAVVYSYFLFAGHCDERKKCAAHRGKLSLSGAGAGICEEHQGISERTGI